MIQDIIELQNAMQNATLCSKMQGVFYNENTNKPIKQVKKIILVLARYLHIYSTSKEKFLTLKGF